MWNPYLSKDSSRLEAVQKFALQICLKDWNSPYHDLREQCQLTELSSQRNYLSLCHLYKIIHKHCIFLNAPVNPYSSNYFTRTHDTSQYIQPHARTNAFYHSFSHMLSLYGTHFLNMCCPLNLYSHSNIIYFCLVTVYYKTLFHVKVLVLHNVFTQLWVHTKF